MTAARQRAGAAMAVPAGDKLRPDQVRAGQRYTRRDGGCVADVLAVRNGSVLLVARWGRGWRSRELTQQNCLNLQLDDFCRRYAA